MKFVIGILMPLMCLCVPVECWEDHVYGIKIKVQETSAKITVSNDNNTITIAFKEIIEVDKSGQTAVGSTSNIKHNFKNFEYQQFSSSPTEIIQVATIMDDSNRNISAVRKNFTAKLNGPAANLNIQVMIFDNNTIIPNADSGEAYQVFNGTVKFGFSLDNWRFCGFNDTCVKQDGYTEIGKYLDVHLAIKGGKETPDQNGKYHYNRGRTKTGRTPQTYNYGGSDVTFSQKYLLNGTWYDMVNGYPRLGKKDNENIAIIRFPVFHSPVYYDPTINISSTKYVSSSETISLFVGVIPFLFLLYIINLW